MTFSKIIEISDGFYKICPTDISLKDTFECGQCFRWNFDGEGFVGVAFGKAVKLIQGDCCIYILGTNYSDIENIWIKYLAIDKKKPDIPTLFPDDKYLISAAAFGRGIHILRQEPLETVISFIISANNNIKRIKKIIEIFCELFGKPIDFKGKKMYAFPDKNDLKKVSVENLSPLHAGFRDKYIFDASQKIVSGEIDFDFISTLNTQKAAEELMKIKGIGRKVADCSLLFGFNRDEVFPKDVWINRVIAQIYGEGFDEKIFGENAGLIQQYLFHYARNYNF